MHIFNVQNPNQEIRQEKTKKERKRDTCFLTQTG